MKAIDWIVLAAVAVCAALAIWSCVRGRASCGKACRGCCAKCRVRSELCGRGVTPSKDGGAPSNPEDTAQ